MKGRNLANGIPTDEYGRVPGDPGYNTCFAPGEDPMSKHAAMMKRQTSARYWDTQRDWSSADVMRPYMAGVGLMVARARLAQQQAINAANLYQYAVNNPVTNIDPSGLIAITIDDAPHQASTQKLLAAFQSFNLRVGFFVIGRNVNAWNGGLTAIIQAPQNHRVGNHSMTHPQPFCNLTEAQMVSEWCQCHGVVQNLTGFSMDILRSPGGAGWLSCPSKVGQSITDVNSRLGTHYREIQGSGADDNLEPDWNAIEKCFSSGNPSGCPAWRQYTKEIDNAIRQHLGGNIIFHDSSSTPSAADFMVHILSYIKDKWGLDSFNG